MHGAGRGVTTERAERTEREYGTRAGRGAVNTGDYVSEEERRLLAGQGGGVEHARRGVEGMGIHDRNVGKREGGGVREKAREVKEVRDCACLCVPVCLFV